MAQLCDRIESARRAMAEVSEFLTAPNQLGLDDNQQQLALVAAEMRTILEHAAAVPSDERAEIQASLHLLWRELQVARALVLQASGIFQRFDESAESDVTLYSPAGVGANRE
jgi:hypothetical protein